MRASDTITLFTVRPHSHQRPYPFVASFVAHGVVVSLVLLGFLYRPQIKPGDLAERYTLRRLELHAPEPEMRRLAEGGIRYPGPQPGGHAPAAGAKPAVQPAASRQVAANLKPARQTLVQPLLPRKADVAVETPVPTIVIWEPEKVPVKTIVPPLPHIPTAADVRPSVDPPTGEPSLADLAIASSSSAKNQLILPSTTSPVVVHGPDKVQMPPETASLPPAQPTPAAVLSLSDLHMKEGTVTLPPANQAAPSSSPGALGPGQPADSPASARAGDATADANGNAAGKEAANGAGKNAAKAQEKAGAGGGAAQPGGARGSPAGGAEAGNGSDDDPSAAHITLPKDGKFGVVVIGSALEERYPETAGLWSGRLAYTVYLHVGLAKSWILQYSLPRSADAAAAGNASHLDPPWPYNIVRPNIDPDSINADALMVHGVVNAAGRFETLAVVFPPQFPQAAFVLRALSQWQFRPAMMGGQITPVEVLLIIPEILD